jgi:glycosyltransferase involved in cell wall biosynthesis
MVLAGLEESKGEVITFLDDDDMYVNNRLEEVYKAFTSFKRLVYFNNSQTIIDENGNVLERPPISKNIVGGSTVIVDVDKLRTFAKKYSTSIVDITADIILKVRVRADVNNSSAAVKRDALEASAYLLKELPANIDNFVFASSLRAGGLMYFTDERLTLYRVHGENWSYYAEIARSGSNETRLKRARALILIIKTYRLIGSMLLDGNINRYLCLERLNKGALLLLPLPELGTLPPELRLSLSDVKLALSCYKVGAEDLVDVVFVMGSALLSPLLASPRGRLVIGKLLERVVEALTTKRSLKRERESLR